MGAVKVSGFNTFPDAQEEFSLVPAAKGTKEAKNSQTNQLERGCSGGALAGP